MRIVLTAKPPELLRAALWLDLNSGLLNCGLSAMIVRMIVQVTIEFEKFVFVTSTASISRAFQFVTTEFAVLFSLLTGNILSTQLVSPLMC